jgi:hypothetical protein
MRRVDDDNIMRTTECSTLVQKGLTVDSARESLIRRGVEISGKKPGTSGPPAEDTC